MKKQLAVVLALSATLGISSIMPQAAPLKVEAASYPNEKENQAITHLNEIRKAVGIQPLTFNSTLSMAAQNHARFLSLNGMSYGPNEVKGLRGFTGEYPRARASVNSDPHLDSYEYFEEVQAAGQSSLIESINNFMDTAYQRETLLSVEKAEIGMGIHDKEVVFDLAKDYSKANVEVAYPYDGQKNVGVAYYGNEYSNALKQFGVDKSGYVISYAPKPEFWLDTDKTIFTLVDSKGTDVPVYKEEHYDRTNFFFPKKELKYNETYTASVSYEDDYGKKGSKTWSFTTKDAPKPKSTMKAKTSDVSWKGRLLINKANEKLYTSKGKVSRKLKKNEVLKIAKTSSSRYTLSNGSYVKKSTNVTYYLGRISSTKGKMTVYTSKGKVYKKYNANLSLKIYSYSNGKFNVGSGRYVKDATNLKYAK